MVSDNQPHDEKPNPYQCYEIRVMGLLDKRWADWFEGLTVTLEEDGNTLLTGPVVDQAALHGLLKKVRDLGLTLISVCPVDPRHPATTTPGGYDGTGQEDASDVN